MLDKVEFEVLDPIRDRNATIEFLNRERSTPINDAIWEWEYNSFPDSVVRTIARSKVRVIGTQFMLPIPIVRGNTQYLSGKAENSFLDALYRGTGTFSELYELAVLESIKNKIKMLWAFTPATRVYCGKLGYVKYPGAIGTSSFQIGICARQALKTSGLLLGAMKVLKRTLTYSITCVRRLMALGLRNISKQGLKGERNLRSELDIQNLFSRIGEQHPELIRLEMTKEFRDWRISRNPNLSYTTAFFYSAEGNLEGYYVYSLHRGSARLADFTTSDKATASAMLRQLIASIDDPSVRDCIYFGNLANRLNRHVFDLFAALGGRFTESTHMPFVVRDLDDEKFSDMTRADLWYLNGLWTEGFEF